MYFTVLTYYSSDRDNCWVWRTDDAELFFDNQETVRFRVEEEHWHDQIPERQEAPDVEQSPMEPQSPYKIVATMEDAGLGPCLWWDGGDDEEE